MAVLLTRTASEPARDPAWLRAQWANVRDASTPRCADSADRTQLVRAHGMRSPAMFYVVRKAVSRRMLHATCHVALPHLATHVQIVSAHDTRSPADVESAAALDSKALHSPACAIIARPSPRDWLRGRSMRIVHSTGGTEAARTRGSAGRPGAGRMHRARATANGCCHLRTPPGCVGAQGDLVMAHVRLQVHGRCAPVGAETPPMRASAAEAAAASRAVAQWDGR